MKTITYTPKLKAQLQLIKKTSEAFTKEESTKSIEQFMAEIKFVKDLLTEAQNIVN